MVAFRSGCTEHGKGDVFYSFLQRLVLSVPRRAWLWIAGSGMWDCVFRIWTLAPGARGLWGTSLPAALVGWERCWWRSGRKATGLFGWWMHLSWEMACFFNRHKNIICSGEINLHTNVTNLPLGDLVFLCPWDGLCIEELGSQVLEVRALSLCLQAHLGEDLSCLALVGEPYHASKCFEQDSCPPGPSWRSDCRIFSDSFLSNHLYFWQLVDLGWVPKKRPCPQEGWGKKLC